MEMTDVQLNSSRLIFNTSNPQRVILPGLPILYQRTLLPPHFLNSPMATLQCHYGHRTTTTGSVDNPVLGKTICFGDWSHTLSTFN